MNKNTLLIITVAFVIALGIIFLNGSGLRKNIQTGNENVQNVVVKDGVQYITITARGGYTPEVSTAQAGIPTKLIVKTNGTYDCSSSLVIRSLKYQKILPQTGEEVIDLGTPQAGAPLQGVCSMGMYNFLVNFK